jgi:GrpB-like predicted nucleotidyltransferase (UPF0157 family)
MVKLRDEALELRDTLEVHAEIMKAYAEATLQQDLAKEMAYYLDDSMKPILEALQYFETMQRVIHCEDP